MKRYFTFFLCAQSWKPAVVILPPLLNNIQAVFSIGNNLQFSTSKLDHSTLNSESKTWTGDILEGELLQSSPQVVFIQKMARKSGIFDFFLFFEGTRRKLAPPYIKYFHPESPEFTFDTDSMKILSFSIKSEIFYPRLRAIGESAFLSYFESLFASEDCSYGFGNETTNVISNPFLYIRDNSIEYQLQIFDFDYRRQIECVYKYNYLSLKHVDGISNPDHIHRPELGIESKWILDVNKMKRGLFVNVKDFSTEGKLFLDTALAPLIPPPKDRNKTIHFFIDYMEMEQIRGDKHLESNPLLDELEVIPGGLATIEIRSRSEYKEWLSILETVFKTQSNVRLAENTGLSQNIDQYLGLFDSNQIYQRYIKRRFEEGGNRCGYLRLYLVSPVEYTRLDVTCCLGDNIENSDIIDVCKVIDKWLFEINRQPEYYGIYTVLRDKRVETLESKKKILFTMNASQLKQVAINLLVLRLDEINESNLRVPFLVFGSVPPLESK